MHDTRATAVVVFTPLLPRPLPSPPFPSRPLLSPPTLLCLSSLKTEKMSPMKRLSIDWYCPWVRTSAATSHARPGKNKRKSEKKKIPDSERADDQPPTQAKSSSRGVLRFVGSCRPIVAWSVVARESSTPGYKGVFTRNSPADFDGNFSLQQVVLKRGRTVTRHGDITTRTTDEDDNNSNNDKERQKRQHQREAKTAAATPTTTPTTKQQRWRH